MKIHTMPQRSDAWRQVRLGKLTGSNAKAILATIKSGEAATRRDYRVQLIVERLVGQSQENGYVNAAMEWGIAHEADAIAAYEARTGAMVTPVGFVEHDTLLAGTSPDGFVGDDGAVSIKCPLSATHLRLWREGVEPSEHSAQNTHELWLTKRAWLDFVSYDPRFPPRLQLFVVRVTRTPAQLAAYESEVRRFLAECETEYQALQTVADLPGTLAAAAR